MIRNECHINWFVNKTDRFYCEKKDTRYLFLKAGGRIRERDEKITWRPWVKGRRAREQLLNALVRSSCRHHLTGVFVIWYFPIFVLKIKISQWMIMFSRPRRLENIQPVNNNWRIERNKREELENIHGKEVIRNQTRSCHRYPLKKSRYLNRVSRYKDWNVYSKDYEWIVPTTYYVFPEESWSTRQISETRCERMAKKKEMINIIFVFARGYLVSGQKRKKRLKKKKVSYNYNVHYNVDRKSLSSKLRWFKVSTNFDQVLW